jgi:single-strand DNA-binding protein
MKSINKIILIGHLGAQPEGRYTQNGVSTATFSLATNEFWIGPDKQKHEHTEWHSIVVWHKLADFATQYLNKGNLIYLEGTLRSRTWENSNKELIKKIEIIANNLVLLDKNKNVT